ncbi:MAG TPA: cytochrome d ubiquinol oxidase subunit II [Longimicrobiales bacterium]|nr:cytochrome d ubiquinol oxidase subunit II [Longimicrobiales bacterium]
MVALWFWLVALMLVGYTVADGFDLGAGTLHLLLARTDEERRLVLRSIGPVWDGNEVWLLAAAGTLYFAFPGLYASSFSGFYLPLMMVLWLLVLRGIGIEFRGHLKNQVWAPFWDVVFFGASALLALFLGVALGNVVRGVPLDADGWFFEPLWTDWGVTGQTGILDWYTVVVGLASLASLAMHGAFWVWGKTDDPIARRARRLATFLWPVVLVLALVVTALTFIVQPLVTRHLSGAPWGYLFAALALAGLALARIALSRDHARSGFFGSAAYLAGMLASAAFGLYPYVLPATTDPAYGLTARAVAAPEAGLHIGLAWWIPGMIIAGAYITYVYRRFAGKVSLEGEGY